MKTIYPHKFIPNLAVKIDKPWEIEPRKRNKTQQPKICNVKIDKIIEVNKKKCVFCDAEYTNPKYGKPYCNKHSSEEISTWTFVPKDLKLSKKSAKMLKDRN